MKPIKRKSPYEHHPVSLVLPWLLLVLVLIAVSSCAVQKTPSQLFTVSHVFKNSDGTRTVWIRSHQWIYSATFPVGRWPDSLVAGKRISLQASDKDTCNCVFKRLK
jgi:hypothetical protein